MQRQTFKAYMEGYNSFDEMHPEWAATNPYRPGDPRHDAWADGWWDAGADDADPEDDCCFGCGRPILDDRSVHADCILDAMTYSELGCGD